MIAFITPDDTQFTYKPFSNPYYERAIPCAEESNRVPLNIRKFIAESERPAEAPTVEQRTDKLIEVVTRLSRLDLMKSEDDFVYQVTPTARQRVLDLLMHGYLFSTGDLVRPLVSSDGAGGVVLEWRKVPKEIKLIVPGSEERRPYIYHQNKNSYDVVEDLNESSLAVWLTWLHR